MPDSSRADSRCGTGRVVGPDQLSGVCCTPLTRPSCLRVRAAVSECHVMHARHLNERGANLRKEEEEEALKRSRPEAGRDGRVRGGAGRCSVNLLVRLSVPSHVSSGVLEPGSGLGGPCSALPCPALPCPVQCGNTSPGHIPVLLVVGSERVEWTGEGQAGWEWRETGGRGKRERRPGLRLRGIGWPYSPPPQLPTPPSSPVWHTLSSSSARGHGSWFDADKWMGRGRGGRQWWCHSLSRERGRWRRETDKAKEGKVPA